MNASELSYEIDAGTMTEVPQADRFYDDNVRGLIARQSFYISPNDTIYSMTSCDGTSTVLTLSGDDEAIFRHRHAEYFTCVS